MNPGQTEPPATTVFAFALFFEKIVSFAVLRNRKEIIIIFIIDIQVNPRYASDIFINSN